MARDWTGRDAALTFFQRHKHLDDTGSYEEAIRALRRSQDHTAIHNKLQGAVRIIRMIATMPSSTHEIDAAICKEWLADGKAREQS